MGDQRRSEELTSCLNQGNGNLPNILGYVKVELKIILAPLKVLHHSYKETVLEYSWSLGTWLKKTFLVGDPALWMG